MAGGSVTITVFNYLPWPVTLSELGAQQGTWLDDIQPLTTIPALTGSWTGTLIPPENEGAIGSFSYQCTTPSYQSPPPSTAVTTFVFNYGCPASGNNSATVSATTVPSSAGGFAVPYQTWVGDATEPTYCAVASGSPVKVEYYLYPRILSVAAQPASYSTAVLNWDGQLVDASENLWTPGPSYNDGNGGSSNPLVFPQQISGAPNQSLWLRAMVMGDLTTVFQGDQVTLNVTMTEVVSQQPIMFESNVIHIPKPLTVTPIAVDLFVKNPAGFDGLASISTMNPGAVNDWVMHTDTVVGSPQLEIYWLCEQPAPMWAAEGGVWVRTLRDVVMSPIPQKYPYVTSTMTSVQKLAYRIATNCLIGSPLNSPPGGGKIYREAGAQYYNDGDYNLWGYYNNSPGGGTTNGMYVNCQDQAGFLQVCLGAVGIVSELLHLNTVGFLNPTFLVGNPALNCNSPDWYLYGRDIREAALVDQNQVPGQCDPPYSPPYGRTWWQDHFIVQLLSPNSGVFDATLGSNATGASYFFTDLTTYACGYGTGNPGVIDDSTTLYDYWNTTSPSCNCVPTWWKGAINVGNWCIPGKKFVEYNTGQADPWYPAVTGVKVTSS
jgi:hypothetical protein